MGWKNKIYLGDNPESLRHEVSGATVDLICLELPSNSNATYNVPFKEKGGEESAAQGMTFEDTQ